MSESPASENLLQRTVSAVIALSPRDQFLLGGLIISTLSILSVGGIMWLWQSVSGLEAKLDKADDALTTIEVLKSEQLENVATISSQEELLRSHEGTSLSAFLESKAQEIGIRDKLSAVRESSSAAGELLQEKRFTVSLKNLSTEEFSKFVYEIESTSYPLITQTTTIKRRKIRDEVTLNVTLDVSVYSLLKN